MTDSLTEKVALRGAFLKVLDKQPFLRVSQETVNELIDAAITTLNTEPSEAMDTRAVEFAEQFANIGPHDLSGLPYDKLETVAAKIRRMSAALRSSTSGSDQENGDA